MTRGLVLAAALLAGISYFVAWRLLPHGSLIIAWKGAGVGLLALWALLSAPGSEGRWFAVVLALGALGDVLIEAVGLTAGALAFLAGHVLATAFYLRHRRAAPFWDLAPIALGRLLIIPLLAFLFPDDRSAAPGIALYATGLGAMAASAWVSRFPRKLVSRGALFFAVSDLLIFARLGPLRDSVVPGLLIWPLYFAGQAMIAIGVVGSLRRGKVA
ncbi:lysoplasmalogenase family protein [Sphingomonas sp. GlSt437]